MVRNTDANKRKLLEILNETPLIQAACQKMGISRATYYRWINSDAEFHEAATRALEVSVGLVTDLAQSKLIELIRQSDYKALSFWLTKRSPEFAQQPIQPSPKVPGQTDPVEALLRAYGLVEGSELDRKANRFLPKERRKNDSSGPRRIILDDDLLS